MLARGVLNKTESDRSSNMNSLLEKESAAPKSGQLKSTDASSGQTSEFKLYPCRWMLQFFFACCMISSGFLMVGFSPISNTIAAIYGCAPFIVQAQTLIFLIAFIPGNFIVIAV